MLTRKPRHIAVLLNVSIILCCLLPALTRAQNEVPNLSSDTKIAAAGFYQLSWSSNESQVELQEDTSHAFTSASTLYRGYDNASLISGKPNGTWYYRIRSVNDHATSAWSPIISVTVDHHSLSRAIVFFILGLIVFIATTIVITRAARKA